MNVVTIHNLPEAITNLHKPTLRNPTRTTINALVTSVVGVVGVVVTARATCSRVRSLRQGPGTADIELTL